MKPLLSDIKLNPSQAALLFLGQAGFLARAGDLTLVVDPYLTDSVGSRSPAFSRCAPPPMEPEQLRADVYVVTHDHTDHLDPETIKRYPHRDATAFIAPRFAAAKLVKLGVPEGNVTVVDVGETAEARGVKLTGVFALPTGADALDTTGYRIEFANGRSFYHTSDTAYCELLLKAAPRAEVLTVPINGKWGNLDVDEAIRLTEAVGPQYVIPCHHDVMALNSENPETFRHFWNARGRPTECVVLEAGKSLVWG
jgi:L-ascorbate 6-phosphate lactonase